MPNKSRMPSIPPEYKELMANLTQNEWEMSGNALALANMAVFRPTAQQCRAVIQFIDGLTAANVDGSTLNDVWFSSPVELAPTPHGHPEENERVLRLFFAEMRRLLAGRLQELAGRP